MPNATGHLAIGKIVRDELHIEDPDFIRGCLIPDLEFDKIKSHYKIWGTKYMIPDLDYVVTYLDMKNKKNLGILCHLLLDYYYLEEYVTPKYPDIDVFDGPTLYHDYDILNKDIVEYFNLDIEELDTILRGITEEQYQKKLKNNLDCIHLNVDGETEILEKEDYLKFLKEVSPIIVERIKKVL